MTHKILVVEAEAADGEVTEEVADGEATEEDEVDTEARVVHQPLQVHHLSHQVIPKPPKIAPKNRN